MLLNHVARHELLVALPLHGESVPCFTFSDFQWLKPSQQSPEYCTASSPCTWYSVRPAVWICG